MTAPAVLRPAVFRPARLRAAREAAGLKLRDVGGALGCHHSIPHRYETGVLEPRASTLAVLAALYKIDMVDLFDQP